MTQPRFVALNPENALLIGVIDGFPTWSDEDPPLPAAITFGSAKEVREFADAQHLRLRPAPVRPSWIVFATPNDCRMAGLPTWSPGYARSDRICIGCGCTDHFACQDECGPCSWLAIHPDLTIGLGLCSSCQEHEDAWRAVMHGQHDASRSFADGSVPMGRLETEKPRQKSGGANGQAAT